MNELEELSFPASGLSFLVEVLRQILMWILMRISMQILVRILAKIWQISAEMQYILQISLLATNWGFTNYILNILNEIPIKIGREGDTCHVRIYWTNYGRNFILEDGTHECQLTKLMLNQYLRMAVLVNEYVPISQVYAWLVLLMLGNPGIVPVPASASTSAHARKPSFQSVYNEMNIKKPIEMHSAKIQLDLVRYDVKLSW